MKVTNEDLPAARIFRDRSGALCAAGCTLHYQEPLKPGPAITRAQAGKTVFVAMEDLPIVLSALGVQL